MQTDQEYAEGELAAVPHAQNLAESQARQAMEAYHDYKQSNTITVGSAIPAAPSNRTASAKPYQYSRLATGTTIRLIYLEPADYSTDPLLCGLKSVELGQELGTYDALSYVWGEARLTHYLHINSENQEEVFCLRITPSLASALRRLRSNTKTRKLWADAVCIHQANVEEKAGQVRMMAQIYKNARCVCVHLGHGFLEVERCFEFFSLLASLCIKMLGRDIIGYDHSKHDSLIRAALSETFDSENFSPVQAFLNLPWFKRRWVIQEAASHFAVVFIYGSEVTTFLHLAPALGVLLYNTLSIDASARASLQSLAMINRLQELIRWQGSYNHSGILTLLVKCHALDCLDNRDRIYSLLQCASDVKGSLVNNLEKPILIQASYDRNAREVYTDLATQCVQNHPTLDILNCAGAFKKNASQELKLPSWVPDWNGSLRYRPLLAIQRFTAGNFDGDSLNDPPYVDGNVLHISGRHINVIEKVTRFIPVAPDDVKHIILFIVKHVGTLFNELFPEYNATQGSEGDMVKIMRICQCMTADFAFLPQTDLLDDSNGEESREEISKMMNDIRVSTVAEFLEVVDRVLNTSKGKEKGRGEERDEEERSEEEIEGDREGEEDERYGKVEEGERAGEGRDSEEGEEAVGVKGNDDFTVHAFCSMLSLTMNGRALFITREGHIGIGPDDVEAGDHVVILMRSRTPLILRPDEHLNQFWIIGDAYVNDFMEGEAAELPKDSERRFLIC